jgi:hypothetical protein
MTNLKFKDFKRKTEGTTAAHKTVISGKTFVSAVVFKEMIVQHQ